MSILRISKNLTNVRNGGTPVIIRDAMFIQQKEFLRKYSGINSTCDSVCAVAGAIFAIADFFDIEERA